MDETCWARWPEYRADLDRVLPGAFARAVANAGTVFELDAGLLDWSVGEAEAKRITQPVLSRLGGESEVLWPRFGETHRLLLAWLSRAEASVLPGAAHGLQLQNPRGTAEALAAFYARHLLPVRPQATPDGS